MNVRSSIQNEDLSTHSSSFFTPFFCKRRCFFLFIISLAWTLVLLTLIFVFDEALWPYSRGFTRYTFSPFIAESRTSNRIKSLTHIHPGPYGQGFLRCGIKNIFLHIALARLHKIGRILHVYFVTLLTFTLWRPFSWTIFVDSGSIVVWHKKS